MLDASGRVIGIVDQIATNGSSETSSGVGFAVPIDLVRSELSSSRPGRTVRHAYLGVSTSDRAPAPPARSSRACRAAAPPPAPGLRSGDVVTRIGSAAIRGTNDLVAAIAAPPRAIGSR